MKILAFLTVLFLSLSTFASSLKTNDIWALPDASGTNALAGVDSGGNLRISGTLSANAVDTTYTNVTSRGTITANDLTATGAVSLLQGTTVNTLSATGAVTAGSTVAIHGAASVNTLAATGLVTMAAAPRLTAQAAATGAVPAAVTLLWAGATTNPVLLSIQIGATNYVIPAYKQP